MRCTLVNASHCCVQWGGGEILRYCCCERWGAELALSTGNNFEAFSENSLMLGQPEGSQMCHNVASVPKTAGATAYAWTRAEKELLSTCGALSEEQRGFGELQSMCSGCFTHLAGHCWWCLSLLLLLLGIFGEDGKDDGGGQCSPTDALLEENSVVAFLGAQGERREHLMSQGTRQGGKRRQI